MKCHNCNQKTKEGEYLTLETQESPYNENPIIIKRVWTCNDCIIIIRNIFPKMDLKV